MQDKEALRIMIRSGYDLQKTRIQIGNRIVANFRIKLGQAPGTSEEELDEASKNVLEALKASYDSITDGVKRIPTGQNFKGHGCIDSYAELCLLQHYLSLEDEEKKQFVRVKKILEDFPIYTEFLKGVKGVGPAMAGVLISEIDISKATYVSSLWKYCGLDVVRSYKLVEVVATKGHEVTKEEKARFPDDPFDAAAFWHHPDFADTHSVTFQEDLVKVNIQHWEYTLTAVYQEASAARSKRKEHLVTVSYLDREKQEKEKLSITFNPFVRTKLLGVLATSILRAGKGPYRDVYDGYKNRLENHPKHQDKTKMHRHRMALRYMVKRLLADLYANWRALEGLPVHEEYSQAKLGIVHKKGAA